MAFQITEFKFGEERGLMVTHDNPDHHLDILPAFGGLLSRVVLHGDEITEGIENYQQLQGRHHHRNFWLMPYQNRIRKGQYEFSGESHQLPTVERHYGNAIHGFFKHVPLLDVTWEAEEEEATVNMKFQYAADSADTTGHGKGYPFPFRAELQYKIHKSGSLHITYRITNTGEKAMPFALGWHPYFTLPGDRKDWKLTHPELEHLVADDQGLPTGQSRAWKEELDFGDHHYDHTFRLAAGPHQLILENDHGKITLQQDEKLSYIQIFTPKDRNAVAIEPISSGTDAYNTGEGLWTIESGEYRQGFIRLDYKKM